MRAVVAVVQDHARGAAVLGARLGGALGVVGSGKDEQRLRFRLLALVP